MNEMNGSKALYVSALSSVETNPLDKTYYETGEYEILLPEFTKYKLIKMSKSNQVFDGKQFVKVATVEIQVIP
jgi:hypothetical protein